MPIDRSSSNAARLAALALAAALQGCSTVRETSPERSATEQLLISRAADQAAERIDLPLRPGTGVFVDATNFEGTDGKYALGAIRERFLELGARLVDDKPQAEVVVEIRAGALSIDEESTLLGIPKIDVPIPLAGALGIPEIALFKWSERRGIAKFAATAYGAKDGALVGSSEPQFGYAHATKWLVLLFVSWSSDDLIPEEQEDEGALLPLPDFSGARGRPAGAPRPPAEGAEPEAEREEREAED